MKKLISLAAAFIIFAPSIALAAGEAAEMRQIYQQCRNSGGVAADNYNAWVAQNGCKCGGRSTGSGQRTCSGASSSSASTGSGGDPVIDSTKVVVQDMMNGNSGDIVNDSAKIVVQGMMNSNSQQMGIGMMGIGTAMIIQGLQGDPAADARRAQAAEQQRQAEEQRRADDLRQQELAKQRILGMLKGPEQSSDLSLKTDDEDSPLTVTETRDSLGSTVLTPTGINSPLADHGLQLKLDDDPDPDSVKAKSSMEARQGFDTAGKIMGSNLPPPPPTPTSDSTPQAKKTQLLNALNSKLKENEAKEQSLKDQLAQLQQSPTPDPVAIGQVQSKLNEVTTTNTQLTQNIEKVTAGETNIGFDEEKGPGDNTAPAVSPSQ
jgi:hypothetical protein